MDPFREDSSYAERRASVRTTSTTTNDQDDYDLNAMAVADGFRAPIFDTPPAQSPFSSAEDSSDSGSSTQVPTTSAPLALTSKATRPSSVAKPPRTYDSLALRHDGPLGHLHGTRSTIPDDSLPSSSQRPTSRRSNPSGVLSAQQAYLQRTLSVATSTTAPVSERSYSGPQRPTHPYGLYTQTTTPPEASSNGEIPVGFGRQDNYQRRLGPDGEDAADLIGPLGHTEELPPYTRYPDEAYARKVASVGSEEAGLGTSTPSPIAPAGAGGIGMATRNPEYESRENLASPQSRLSTRSVTSDVASQHEVNTAADTFNEKIEGPKWRQRANRRLWGVVPCWAVFLVAVALLIMGIVLGAVIGTLFADDEIEPKDYTPHPDDDAYPITMTSVTMDTIPLPTRPADLPNLKLGTFSLPPLVSSKAPTTCFNDTSQAQAWTCNIPFNIYTLILNQIPDELPVSEYNMQFTMANPPSTDLYTWGTQPPIVDEPIPMRLVNDTYQLRRGPAWYGQATYNKTVIIAEDRFPNVGAAQSYKTKRRPDDSYKDADFLNGAGVIGAQVGDRPWICTWPGTILEVFIYPSQQNSFGAGSESSSSDVSSRAINAATTTSSLSAANPSPEDGISTPTLNEPLPTTSRKAKVAAPSFPNVIKIEESRLNDDDSTAAVCQQIEICEDGLTSKPVIGEDGFPVEVLIVENARLVNFKFEESKRWVGERSRLAKRVTEDNFSHLSECGCIWWFT